MFLLHSFPHSGKNANQGVDRVIQALQYFLRLRLSQFQQGFYGFSAQSQLYCQFFRIRQAVCPVQKPPIGQAEEGGDLLELVHIRDKAAVFPQADGVGRDPRITGKGLLGLVGNGKQPL